jgi:rare lipoprotein A (peptidoglycan hydrolase)
MPVRRAISISLACLVTSACAIAETPDESTTPSINVTPGNAEIPVESRSFACGAGERRSADYGFEMSEDTRANLATLTEACDDASDHCCSRMRAAGRRELGRAAWYGMVGNRTASGELLDTRTATAAHRSLPLASYARVTNLDNGRSVIVKINDRGPFTRGRIIDLSPRAADVLEMKHAGVAAVAVEPMVN